MLIGLDFDNTIVRYDAVFARLAGERGLPDEVSSAGKTAIRDHLRAEGREDEWTIMQGEAYGSRMSAAEEFDGVANFMSLAAKRGHGLVIVSHRTRAPYLGPPADLHASAREWLSKRGFRDLVSDFFLEESAAEKAARIGAVGCEVFVDDLWEFLERPDFPAGVRKIWLDGSKSAGARAGLERAAGWSEVETLLLG